MKIKKHQRQGSKLRCQSNRTDAVHIKLRLIPVFRETVQYRQIEPVNSQNCNKTELKTDIKNLLRINDKNDERCKCHRMKKVRFSLQKNINVINRKHDAGTDHRISIIYKNCEKPDEQKAGNDGSLPETGGINFTENPEQNHVNHHDM